MRKQVQVTADVLRTRRGPGTNYESVSNVYQGQTYIVNQQQTLSDGSIWMKSESTGLWSCYKTSSGSYYLKITKDLEQTTTVSAPYDHSFGYSDGIDSKVLQMLYDNSREYDALDVSTRLFGSPHQFLSTADIRVNTKVDLGRKFIENIVAESPIVNIMPGKANFLPNTSKQRKKIMKDFFSKQNISDSTAKEALAEIIKEDGEERYFDFVTDHSHYMRIVNMMCRVAALYLGIGEQNAPGTTTKYKYYNWENYKYYNVTKEKDATNKSVFSKAADKVKTDVEEQIFGRGLYVPFYVEPNMSFTESATNNTQTSKMESFFDQAEGLVKELAFLTDAAALGTASTLKENLTEDINKIKDKMFAENGDGFFTRLLGATSATLSGGNMIFPEIWGDSAYNKSYSITINLVSPYGDKESIYLNIIVPMLHLLAFSLPQQISANAYSAPMLIKAFCKGWFSIDMGIVESISIEKGGNGDAWSVDGLPTQVKVQLSIKDLYTELSVPDSGRAAAFMQNQSMIDFLAVTCGVDITEPTFILKIKTMFAIFTNKLFDMPQNWYNEFLEELREILEPLINI